MPLTPMLVVQDVEASSAWLRGILPLTSAHGGPEFEMLADQSGQVVAWLHAMDPSHPHPQLAGMRTGELTGGAIFYLQVPDVDAIHRKAIEHSAKILQAPSDNPLARFREFTFEDPNGYRFAAHTAFGSVPAKT